MNVYCKSSDPEKVKRILKDKLVLLTRPKAGSEEFQRKLDFEKADVIAMPMIDLQLKEDQSEMDAAFDQLETYDWLVFTSSAAVRFFFQRVEEQGLKMYFFPDLKIATVGEKTKVTLEQLGYRTNFVPIQFTAEVLAENLPDIEDKKILIPASDLSGSNYIEEFKRRGAKPAQIVIYNNVPVKYSEAERQDLKEKELDYLTFTSGSTVRSFHEQFGPPQLSFPKARNIYIGPSTAKVARSLNWQLDAIAELHTVEGMIESMKEIEKQNYDPTQTTEKE